MAVNALIGQSSPGQIGALGDPGTLIAPLVPSSPGIVYIPGICSPVVMPIDDFYGLISSATDSSWNIDSSVIKQVAASWKIPQQQVTATVSTAWNVTYRVEKNDEASGLSMGILQPVVHPIDWRYVPAGMAWQLDQRSSSTSTSMTWNVIQRRSSTKAVNWNVLISDHSEKITSWRVLQRVYVPGYTAEDFYVGILQPVVHPIDLGPNLIVPISTWNYGYRTSSRTRSSYSIDATVTSSRQAFSWFVKDQRVTTSSVAASWFTRLLVQDKNASTWNLGQRPATKAKTSWFTDGLVTTQKAINFKVGDRVRVIRALTTEYMLPTVVVHPISYYQTVIPEFQWNVVARVPAKVRVSYNTDEIVKIKGASSWNTLMRMSIPFYGQIYYPQIMQPVVHPITAKTYPWIARIQWGFTNLVSPTVPTAWNALNKVVKTNPVSWNTVGRTNMQEPIAFMTRISVVSQAVIQWNVGQALQNFIRQAAMSREDFAY